MTTILKRKVVKKNGDVSENNFPVTVSVVRGRKQYFYAPHGFCLYAEDIGRKFNQFDGSTVSWSVENEVEAS